MSQMMRLRAQKGTDEANIGTNRYPIHDDGFFYIPSGENIEGLLTLGGFTIAEDQTPTVAIRASRLAVLEAEESQLRAEHVAPTRLVIPS
jgi:hypothetical protein